MSIKQFNCKYSLSDDRIIFRFNTIDHSEYVFWLTRRVTHIILKSTSRFFENEYKNATPSVENVISEIQQADKQATNFTKAYEPGAQYPMGGETLLVMDVKCNSMKIEGQDIFSLDFILPGGSNLNLKLTVPVMKALIMLLEEANVHAKWGNPAGTLHLLG